MRVRPLHDWLVVEVEPVAKQIGSILVPDVWLANPIRTAKVLAVGPGRRNKKTDVLVPTQVKVGDRVCFHTANLEHKQGRALLQTLDDKQGMIQESDIFMVLGEELRVDL